MNADIAARVRILDDDDDDDDALARFFRSFFFQKKARGKYLVVSSSLFPFLSLIFQKSLSSLLSLLSARFDFLFFTLFIKLTLSLSLSLRVNACAHTHTLVILNLSLSRIVIFSREKQRRLKTSF